MKISREPGARARAHEPDVVRDLRQRDGDRLQGAGELHEGVAGGLCLEGIGRWGDREARLLLQPLADSLGELGMGVEARADGGTAERDLAQARQRCLDAGDALPHLGRVAAELLSQRHGHGVHEMRAARLDDVVELLRLALERGRQRGERGQQVVRRLIERGEVNRGREDVVRRLAHVHVVVGVDVVPRQRGDHLVGVHVRRRARARLEDVDRELVVELATGDAVGGGGDALGLVGCRAGPARH